MQHESRQEERHTSKQMQANASRQKRPYPLGGTMTS